MVASGGTGRTSKGRRPIEIAYIDDPARRMVAFSKRKKGLLKKASDLSILCDARVAAVVFSQAGRPFAFGSPSVDHVLDLYGPLPAGDEEDEDGLGGGDRGAVEATAQRKEATWARVAEEGERMKDIGEKVLRAAAGRLWWEALGPEELREFARALRRLRDNVRRRADKLPVAPVSQPTTTVLQ